MGFQQPGHVSEDGTLAMKLHEQNIEISKLIQFQKHPVAISSNYTKLLANSIPKASRI